MKRMTHSMRSMADDLRDGVLVWSGPENLVGITGENDDDPAVDRGGREAEVVAVATDVLVAEVEENGLAAGAVVTDDDVTAAETRVVAVLNAMAVIVALIAMAEIVVLTEEIAVNLGVKDFRRWNVLWISWPPVYSNKIPICALVKK